MSDHLTNTEIENYSRHLFSAAESLSVSDHLAGCEMCRRRLESVLNDDEDYLELRAELLSEAEASPSPIERGHLTIEEMAGLVDGNLSGEELQVVKDHLTGCEECELSVEDLRGFKDQITPGFSHNHRPSTHQVAGKNRWDRLLGAMHLRWPKSPVLVFGSALAACLLAVAGWLLWRERQSDKVHPLTTRATPSLGASPATSPSPAPGSASPYQVQLNDGDGLLALNREGHLSGGDYLPPDYRRMIESALSTQEIERPPMLSELTRPEIKPRGSGEESGDKFSVLEPVGKVTISDRPTFRWSQLNGATSYTVEVYDKLKRVALSPPIAGLSWTPTEPLKRGRVYAWQVKAPRDGRVIVSPSPPRQATFLVLDQAKTVELSRARRAYASSHLALGLLYAQAGLFDKAERELRALRQANPNSEVADRLLKQVRKMRSP